MHKISLLVFICLLISPKLWATDLSLLPYPQSLVMYQGELVLTDQWFVVVQAPAAFQETASSALHASIERFRQRLNLQTGRAIEFTLLHQASEKLNTKTKPNLIIQIQKHSNAKHFLAVDESYHLLIDEHRVLIRANESIGAMRSLETLAQLIGLQDQTLRVPQVAITDAPHFPWRGLLLDSARHFFNMDAIKRQLDMMAAAKLNVFHWHLTDDQGWRLESTQFPRLHQHNADGHYYTRAQVKEVITYARERGIEVLPEIDMPGHASSIAIAYPELMSAPGPYTAEIRWGIHKPTLNPANDKVYEFVDKLMAELVELFPFAYVHIGGDEVDPQHWNDNKQIQKFMQQQGLKDHLELHAYFNQRVQKILHKHGRTMIGWDEIQHPALARNIVIHSWQGPDGISQAVRQGFKAILSTGFYLDQPQTAAYHYRQDPLPPTPVEISPPTADEIWQSWSFVLPRKRGKPVTGSVTLIGEGASARGFIDFSGKSRRAVLIEQQTPQGAIFSLDTWMGPTRFHAAFHQGQLQGETWVGNVAYPLTGNLLASGAGTGLPAPERESYNLSDAEQERVLGGEAALWSELVDENSLDLRLWPRGFAVAERLWSPKELRDEDDLYQRLETTMTWARLSLGLQDLQQQLAALERLAGDADTRPLLTFIEALEPAHYYHRHHEKSVNETYSRADPLDRLVDALPAENSLQRDLLSAWSDWRFKKDINAQKQLKMQLKRWIDNHQTLSELLEKRKELQALQPLANDLLALSHLGMRLLDNCERKQPLSAQELAAAKALLHQSGQMREEIVISASFVVKEMLQSGANCP